MRNTILIVDDEKSICLNLSKYFTSKGFKVETAQDGKTGIEICESMPVGLVLLDLQLPDMSGLEVLKKIKSGSPGTGVIIITAYGDVETAVRAMQMKADNFILKPVDLDTLGSLVNKVLDGYRTQAELQYLKRKVSRLEGSSNLKRLRQPQEVYHAIQLLAENPYTTVLILGETGSGKGMVAKIIHELSDRRDFPFVDINCAGLSGELLESELFGHEKGAFTDAKDMKKGLMEVANEGSLFLDEIGELSMAVQAKLLKVLEQKSFRRLGGTANIEVDVRIMAATNTDLEAAVRKNEFRKDLYFRLNVMPVTLPPLRERRDDVLPLAEIFLEDFNTMFRKKISRISPEAESMLTYYSWPGNIRELRNVIERATLLCDKDIIEPAHLPENMRAMKKPPPIAAGDDWSLESMERSHIERVLLACDHNCSKASKILGIHRSTILNKMKKYNL